MAANDAWQGQNDWQENALKHKGDVSAVICATERTETGVTYEVRLVLDSVISYEMGDNERNVWCSEVTFGHTDATVAGGAAFVEMARWQHEIAERVWHLTRPS